jgi:hypothetical protein
MDATFTPVEVTTKVVTQAVVTFMASNLFISFLASGSLQLLWSFVNSLQLISYMPLMNLEGMPGNVLVVLSMINGPMQFKVV